MELAEIFTSYMVLQQGVDIPVWGKGEGPVTVTFNGSTVQAQAQDGKWTAVLPKQAAGGPYQLRVDGPDKSILLEDVLVGEVWIAAGQSNMEMPLFCTERGVEDAQSADNDNIRFYCVPRRPYKDAKVYGWHFERCFSGQTAWQPCTTESACHFTAIGYYFAQQLQSALKVPIGIISCNWGGTKAEWWIDEAYLQASPQFASIWDEYAQRVAAMDAPAYEQAVLDYEQAMEAFTGRFPNACDTYRSQGREAFIQASNAMGPWPEQPYGPKVCGRPAALYHGMVEEIIPFAAKGVLWYQGESNCGQGECEQYADLFALLVQNWRTAFQNPGLPFYTVQLAPFADCDPETWARLREQQLLAAAQLEHCGIVGTIDAGDDHDIHPQRKAVVGRRLADLALTKTYGLHLGEYQGPICQSVQFEGDCAVLSFSHVGDGLVIRFPLEDLEICGPDRLYHPAQGRVEGGRLIVSSPSVPCPIAVRYGWRSAPSGGLYNDAGYPAYPFGIGDF